MTMIDRSKPLVELHRHLDGSIRLETILDLALRLLTLIQDIHSAGFAYNDLKLDNIMVGYGQRMVKVKPHEEKSSFSDVSLHLVDFGYSSKFMKKKAHI